MNDPHYYFFGGVGGWNNLVSQAVSMSPKKNIHILKGQKTILETQLLTRFYKVRCYGEKCGVEKMSKTQTVGSLSAQTPTELVLSSGRVTFCATNTSGRNFN